jgi:hypothetical protein
MSGEYLAERESLILGREFLTWLWFNSEARGGSFTTSQGEVFEIHLGEKVQVEGGEGDNLERAVVSGRHSSLREAVLGLAMGKKVDRATLSLVRDADEWSVQVKAQDFSLGTLKTPKVDTSREEGEDPDAVFLEKMYLLETAVGYMDVAFRRFLQVRLSAEWKEEADRLKAWVRELVRSG